MWCLSKNRTCFFTVYVSRVELGYVPYEDVSWGLKVGRYVFCTVTAVETVYESPVKI